MDSADEPKLLDPTHDDKPEKLDSKIVKMILSTPTIELFHDEFDEPYVRFVRNGLLTSGPIRSGKFRKYVSNEVYVKMNQALSRDMLDRVMNIFEAKALHDGKQCNLSIRVARHNDEIWYDLGSSAVRINKDGWEIVRDPPNLFRRYSLLDEQVEPVRGGSIEEISKFVNTKDTDEAILLYTFIVAAFVPDIPHPILALHGPQGSAKSTLLKFLLKLIDPSKIEDTQVHDFTELQHGVSHRWVVPFDNLSSVSDRLSDLFCKLVTGGGISKRELYTNDDDVIRYWRRVLILNGVNLPIHKPDILDRSLIIGLERISELHRRDEATLYKEFEAIRGELLGACFDCLSKAMGFLPEIRVAWKSRMADYTVWGCAITKALGLPQEIFIDAYAKNNLKQTEEAVDASPLASSIVQYMTTSKSLEGTATDVLARLKGTINELGLDEKYFPKTPRALGRKLEEIKPNLEKLGLQIEKTRDRNERRIKITKPGKDHSSVIHVTPSAKLSGEGPCDKGDKAYGRTSTVPFSEFDESDPNWGLGK